MKTEYQIKDINGIVFGRFTLENDYKINQMEAKKNRDIALKYFCKSGFPSEEIIK